MKKHQLAFKTILLLFLALSSSYSTGQTTEVKGKVLDESNNPMPFVNINFVNSHIGTTTDFDGMYSIETKWATDNLSASFLGCQKEIQNIVKNKNQTKNGRRRISSKHSVFIVKHTMGVKGFFNGEHQFSKSTFEIIKRIYVPLMGHSDVNVEVGKF